MQVRVLGAHNLEDKESRHTCFLVDGVLGIDAGSLASALTPGEQRKVRALLLTHEHFDHTRDLPTLGLATLDAPRAIEVFALRETLESVRAHLMDDRVYPNLTKRLNDAPPKIRFRSITADSLFRAVGYQVKAVPASHPVPAVGYIVRSSTGDCIAYTGDTGGDLAPFFQDPLSPQVVFVDVTFSSSLESRAKLTGHLTPALLGGQIREALRTGTRLPRIVPVHVSVQHQAAVLRELSSVGAELGVDLTPAQAGAVFVNGRVGGDG